MYKKVESPTETTTKFYLQDAMGKTVALRRKVGLAAATWEYYVNASEREARIKNVTHNGIIAPQEIEFYLYDHLGNTRVVYEHTYAGGGLAELVINYAADYFSYGKILREYVNTNSGDPEKFLTTQHERDKETGLDYRGARFYDSDISRFLSIDPWQTKYPSWSTYNYVMGNPISFIDPTGRSPEGTGDDKKKKKEDQETPASFDSEKGGDLPELTATGDAPDYGGMMQERSDQNLNNAIASLTTGRSVNGSCQDCLDPSSLGNNLLGLTYPGGNNPITYNKDPDYSYTPSNLSEYPAIGHDRRYDKLEIKGASGLFTDPRAIGADWKFVGEELKIAGNAWARPADRLSALTLGIGLGISSLPKTMLTISSPQGINKVLMWYIISSNGVNNTPTKHEH